MQPQEQANGKTLSVFRQLITLIVMLVIIAVFADRYFSSVNNVSAQGLAIEHNRLVNVLAMVRSQWLSLNRPDELQVDWLLHDESPASNRLTMHRGGWPTVTSQDNAGCEQLWQQLLGLSAAQSELNIAFDSVAQTCQYIAANGQRIEYQLNSGQVRYSADVAN